MSDLAKLVDGLSELKLRQSRAVGRALERYLRALKAEVPEDTEEISYRFAVETLAAALDKTPAEIEEMPGQQLALAPLVPIILRLAGFALGEAKPVASQSTQASPDSMGASPPAAATRRSKSAK